MIRCIDRKTKIALANCPELSKQLCSHHNDDLHGCLWQKILLTEWSLPAITTGLLPCLSTKDIMSKVHEKSNRNVQYNSFSMQSLSILCRFRLIMNIQFPFIGNIYLTWKVLKRAMWSLKVLAENHFLLSRAAFFWEAWVGSVNGSLLASVQAMVKTGSKHLSTTAHSTILPRYGSMERSARWWPRSVRSSHGFMASIFCRGSTERDTFTISSLPKPWIYSEMVYIFNQWAYYKNNGCCCCNCLLHFSEYCRVFEVKSSSQWISIWYML